MQGSHFLFVLANTHTPEPLRILILQDEQDHLCNSGFGLLRSVPTISESSS